MARFRFKRDGHTKLQRAREADGGTLTNPELAELTGVHRATIHRIVNDDTPPGIPFLAGAMLAFGPEWFNELFEAVPDETDIRAGRFSRFRRGSSK